MKRIFEKFYPRCPRATLIMAAITVLIVGFAHSELRTAPSQGLRLWQTNSEGDDIHIFNAHTGELLHRMVVGPEPHGVAAADDGRIIYVSIEANDRTNGELLWIDPVHYRILHRLLVGPEPHAIAASPDGRWVYIPCRDGSYWVIDAERRRVVKRIHTGGRPHNTQISRDGRFAYLSPMTRGEPGAVTVVDIAAGHTVLGTIPYTASVRPPALTADGRRLLQHVDALNGFEVGDVQGRRLSARVEHSNSPPGLLVPGLAFLGWIGVTGAYRCHGLGIRPDQTEVWSTCGSSVHIHRLPDYSKRIGEAKIKIEGERYSALTSVALPGRGYWITFAPDNAYAFVALSGLNQVAMIDTKTKRVVRLLDAGLAPRRNLVVRSPGTSVSNGITSEVNACKSNESNGTYACVFATRASRR